MAPCFGPPIYPHTLFGESRQGAKSRPESRSPLRVWCIIPMEAEKPPKTMLEPPSDSSYRMSPERMRHQTRPAPRRSDADKAPTIRAIDVFCGIGGLTYGLRSAGLDVVLGLDSDISCRYAYETNNDGAAFLKADVRDVHFSDLESHFGESQITALVGCAPCQPFSSHTRRNTAPRDDCELVDEFARLVGEGTPDLVSMENVPGLAKHPTFGKLVELLRDLNYDVAHGVIDFHKFGVPQHRRRLVMVASRLGSAALPEPTNCIGNVADFIADIQPINAGQTWKEDPAHTTLALTPINLERIRQSKPGGTWQDWDEALVNPCQKRAHYPAPYGRMRWDEPAPTITTQFCYYSTGRFGHPNQDRALSVREAALLQTFPRDYKLVDPDSPLTIRKLARHVGNAVPVKIAELIGSSLMGATASV